jgi:hypothetical protein
MAIFLILVLAVAAFLVFRRFQVAARGQRITPPPGVEPPPPPADKLPLRASDQVTRATRAAEGTHTDAQHLPRAEEPPL